MTTKVTLSVVQSDASDSKRLSERRAVQSVLPQFQTSMRSNAEPQFAHPAERHVARVFNYFRVRWAYEPTTFVLPPLPDGRPQTSFTPDFYLPDHRLYIELTTMRQRLVTRKNSKVRRLQEAFPNVQVKLLYRRDYLRLMNCYRGALAQASEQDVAYAFATSEEIERRISEVAMEIAATGHLGQPSFLILSKGATHFQRVLASHLENLGINSHARRIALRRNGAAADRARVDLSKAGSEWTLERGAVVVVTDVVSTGLSLAHVLSWLRRRGVARPITCALLDRPAARLVDAPLDVHGFTAPNDVLVGFGLQLRPSLANLPYIGVLRTTSDLDGLL